MTLNDALETLALLPDWEQRYTFLIELAQQLPPMEAALKTPATLVKGCTAQVWLVKGEDAGRLVLHIDSDALIVRGLLTLVWLAYNGKTKADIAATDLAALLTPTHLLQHLSPNRRNGLVAVLAHVRSV